MRLNRMSPLSTLSSSATAPSAVRLLAAAGVTLALMVVLSAPLPVAHAQRAQDRDRAMYVTVTDRSGTPVTGLKAGDFVIREDGVQREVLRVAPATSPVDIALIVDNSEPAEPAIADMRRALTEFVKEMASGNDITIVAIGGRPQMLQDYTRNGELLNRAIGRLFAEPGSGAYLLEALSSVAGGVSKRAPERALIVAIFMRSGPEFSGQPYETVAAALRGCGAAFDAIVLEATPSVQPPTRGAQARAIQDRDRVLDEGTRETGGVYRQVLSSMALAPELKSIADLLRNQYRVVYARPESLIPPQKISVSVKDPGMTARGTPVKAK